jgi:GAF domain-containing protein
MRRRSRAGNKPTKARSRKAKTLNAARRSNSSVATRETEVARFHRERDEALEREAATSEVLRLISKSPGDLELVFRSILENATRICEAKFGVLHLYESGGFRLGATHNAPSAFAQAMAQREPIFHPTPHHHLARVAATKRLVQVSDIAADEAYKQRDPGAVRLVEFAGARSLIAVPMLRDDVLIGDIVIYRQEVRRFTDKQIELLTNFAAQAVIAIENARLLNELRQRTTDLTESLGQQTATSEVLRVISSSPSELTPVFESMLANATRLCEANFGTLNLHDNGSFPLVAAHNAPEAYVEHRRRHPIVKAGPQHPLARVAASKQVLQIADMRAEPLYRENDPSFIAMVDLAGARTLFVVPMLRDNDLLGTITIFRQEIRPFTEKQIALVKNFAAQAVIAIENARLLNELRESLQQQTATADVLGIISSSPGELQPVFQAMLENATRICEAKFATLLLREGDEYRAVALHNAPAAYIEERKRNPLIRPASGALARLAATKRAVHIADLRTEQSYVDRSAAGTVVLVEAAGARSYLAVPMIKDDELIGAIVVYRQEVKPFADKQIELVKNFAAQAVIAIENTRLLNELRQRTADLSESLEQQTATSEVLRVISSSPGDLKPVFEAMLTNATRLCEAKFGLLYLYEEGRLRFGAAHDVPPAFAEARGKEPFTPSPDGTTGRVVTTKQPAQVVDLAATQSYSDRNPVVVAAVEVGGVRTAISVPMLKENALIGVISIYRKEVRPFTEKQIELVKNFAAQAVIAIENARLLNELRESLEQQTATADVLRIISSSQGDLKPVFESLLANAVRLCEAKFGTLLLYTGNWRFRVVAMSNAPPAFAELRQREPIFEVTAQSPVGRAVATKDVVHIADFAQEATYRERRLPAAVALGELGGARTFLIVPMLKDNELVGAIVIYRQEVRPFTDKQIELVKNFAAQAVIAIENTRLLNELRESLQQQTATADVLKVISRSTFDLKAVLRTLVESAAHVCEADISNIALPTAEGTYQIEAGYGQSAALDEELRRQKFKPGPGGVISRTALSRSTVHILDAQTDPDYQLREALRIGGYHTMLGIPMLREGNIVGVFGLARNTVRPFTEKQIELVATFADQAVIAIENARLLNELRQRTGDLTESLEQQTATSKVLEVISRSAFDLQAVFETVAESSVRLCGADRATIWRFDGELLRMVAAFNAPQALKEFFAQNPIRPGRGSITGRAVLERRTIQIPDVLADPEYTYGSKDVEAIRTLLAVPMLKGDDLLGVLGIYHLEEVMPFTDKPLRSTTFDYWMHFAIAPMNSDARSASYTRSAKYPKR